MNHTRGIYFILISAFFYGSYGVWSRFMAGYFGEFSQAWTRGLCLFIIVIAANLFLKFFHPVQKSDLKWFILIGLAGGINQAPYFYGFKYLTVGTATLLFYAALVVGGYLIGKLVFKEILSLVKIVSLILALCGMFFIFRLSLTPAQLLPATLTIIAGLLGATGVVLSKKLSGKYPELQIMTAYFIAMVVFNFPLALIFRDATPSIVSYSPWLSWLGYGFAYVVANIAVIEGFKHLEASVGSLIGLAEILFGILFGVLFFGETITLGTIIGASLIITSAALPNLLDKPSNVGYPTSNV